MERNEFTIQGSAETFTRVKELQGNSILKYRLEHTYSKGYNNRGII